MVPVKTTLPGSMIAFASHARPHAIIDQVQSISGVTHILDSPQIVSVCLCSSVSPGHDLRQV